MAEPARRNVGREKQWLTMLYCQGELNTQPLSQRQGLFNYVLRTSHYFVGYYSVQRAKSRWLVVVEWVGFFSPRLESSLRQN